MPIEKGLAIWYNKNSEGHTNTYKQIGEKIMKLYNGMTTYDCADGDAVRALRNHKSAQCFVQVNKNAIVFVSYNTPVIYLEHRNGIWKMTVTGTYSQTTRKQIGWFLSEYVPSINYYTVKDAYNNGETMVVNDVFPQGNAPWGYGWAH